MVLPNGYVQNSAEPIGDVQERTYPTEGTEVSITTCTVSEEILDEDVTERIVLNKEIRLVS